jgi:hypothetical protein
LLRQARDEQKENGVFAGCWPLCHDDGSNHWHNEANVVLWGGQKSNMGHDLTFKRNLV